MTYDDASGKPTLSLDVSPSSAEKTLSDVFDYLKEHNRRTVIAIDEFQQVGDYPEKGVEAILRSHIQFSPARFIFAGSRQHLMREMFTSPKRPFFQSSLMMPLDVIAEDSYYDFAAGFFKAAGRCLDRDVFTELYSRFDGVTWYMQAILWDLYASGEDATEVKQLDEAVRMRIRSNEYDQQRILDMLLEGACRLLRAIARERVVKAPQSADFISKYGLRAASSVKTSLDMLVDKELIYRGNEGYIVYDRLFGLWLAGLPW